MEPKEASSEFVGRAKSTLSPPRDGRRESSITISPTPSGEPISNSSSSSEDESVDMFNRRGHQGSYVLRKVANSLPHTHTHTTGAVIDSAFSLREAAEETVGVRHSQ